MKALVPLLIILFTGASALAQNPKQNDKVDSIEMGIVMVDSVTYAFDSKTVKIDAETSIVRLYRNKNSRVKKELAFITKTNYGKLA